MKGAETKNSVSFMWRKIFEKGEKVVKEIKQNEISLIEKLFSVWSETMIWSCLQGCMGKAFAVAGKEEKSAMITIADFCL